MPDIAMCRDVDCLMKETCYRYKAKINPAWQSYFVETPRCGDTCGYYWEIKKEE